MRAPLPPDVLREFSIRETESYEVTWGIPKIKQNDQEVLPALYIVFRFAEAAESLHFTYRLQSDESPEPFEGKLHVIINADDR